MAGAHPLVTPAAVKKGEEKRAQRTGRVSLLADALDLLGSLT